MGHLGTVDWVMLAVFPTILGLVIVLLRRGVAVFRRYFADVHLIERHLAKIAGNE